MFKLLIITVLIGFAAAVVSDDDVHAEATLVKSDVRADGYDTALETTNHIHQVASGDEHNSHGDFSWISPEGVHVAVQYIADENGYQPSSDLLPTPPPIPEAILKAIEYIKSHPSKDDSKH